MRKADHNQENNPDSSSEELMDFEITKFDDRYKNLLKNFDSGQADLDRYAKQQLSQDMRRSLAVPYLMVTDSDLLGFYTLSNSAVDASEFLRAAKGVGRYLPVPVTLLGRLAVDKKYHGNGFGGILLLDALEKVCLAGELVGSKAVIVDPIDDQAIAFYDHFGFLSIPDTKKMMMTIEEVKKLI